MSYRGLVKNGVIVLEAGTQLPEGTVVRVEPIGSGKRRARAKLDPIFRMGDLAVSTGIPDLATNIDHYLYGHPKVEKER
jgi:hypothetical protein